MHWYQLITFICAFSAVHCIIYFRKYCLNGTDPDTIPSEGKNSAGIIRMNDMVLTYDPGLNCSVTITAGAGHRLLISFMLVSLRNSSFDTLTIFYNNDTQSAVLSGQAKCLNGSCTGLMFNSGPHSASVTFHFITSNITVDEQYHGFKALYTSYNMVNENGVCESSDSFVCRNSHCVAKELVCDGNNNCGDSTDELGCHIPNIDTIWGVVVIVLAIASVALFVPAFCFVAVKGTMSVVTFINVPVQPTPLYSAINNDEGTALLTSSAERSSSCYWGSSSCSLDRRHSYSSNVTIKATNKPSTSHTHGSYQGESGIPS